jgi:hypothetical protein
MMALKMIQPTENGRRSKYTKDGSFARKLPRCRTVGSLKKLLDQLPERMPLNRLHPEETGGVTPVWYNVGDESEHLSIEAED